MKSCNMCGSSTSSRIVDDGYQVEYRCPKHGLVGGTLYSRKMGLLDRLSHMFWKAMRGSNQSRKEEA